MKSKDITLRVTGEYGVDMIAESKALNCDAGACGP